MRTPIGATFEEMVTIYMECSRANGGCDNCPYLKECVKGFDAVVVHLRKKRRKGKINLENT